MTQKEIIKEANKMVAKFMNYPIKSYPLEYHSSWDWLMPVVEKIENIGFAFKQCRRRVEIWKDLNQLNEPAVVPFVKKETKILSAYFAVIQFIQWFNNNTSSQLKK